MALDKTKLKTDIIALLNDMMAKETDSVEEYATRLSDAIDVYVKSGTVHVTVSTTGTASAQTGTGTGNVT